MGTTKTPVLPDAEMWALGFTDHVADQWYWCRSVDSDNTTLNFTINKQTGVYDELVMNEDFGQPEYYGRMKPRFRDAIQARIDSHLALLNGAGLTLAVDPSKYGVSGGGDG